MTRTCGRRPLRTLSEVRLRRSKVMPIGCRGLCAFEQVDGSDVLQRSQSRSTKRLLALLLLCLLSWFCFGYEKRGFASVSVVFEELG